MPSGASSYSRRWTSSIVALLAIFLGAASAHAQPINVDDLVDATVSGFRLNRGTRTFDAIATLTNGSEAVVRAPIQLVAKDINPPSATLVNASGTTPDGFPFIDVPLDDDELSPGEQVGNILLKFSNDNRERITFTAEVRGVLEEPEQPPQVTITSPPDGLITQANTVDVSGAAPGATSVSVNGIVAAVMSGLFTAEAVPLVEGTNRLVATATNDAGDSASDSISVRRDTDPPQIVIEAPANGSRLVSEVVTVAGTVSDIIPGATINADDVQVIVNGFLAPVSNRTFILPDLSLELGPNTIEAVATDVAGNTRTTSIEVTREPDLAGIRLEILQGNNQRALVNTLLAIPLEVRVTSNEGDPLVGRPVSFKVSNGDGLLDNRLDNLRERTLLTDAGGRARVAFNLGSRSGEGFHRVLVTTPGSLTFVEFCETATPAAEALISINRFPPIRGIAGQALSDLLSVIVTDGSGNPVPGVDVTVQVELGGGSFAGADSAIVPTNADGIAEAEWTLGPDSGVGNNQAFATFDGNTGFPAFFEVSAFETGAPQDTSVSGIVQDSTGEPIVGARAVIHGTALEGVSGPDGRFTILSVPPGGHRVAIHGSEASRPADDVFFPDIEFAIEAISGADNALDQVVALPFLDQAGAKLVGGSEDVVLEMQGVPGFGIKVFANSVILPSGRRGELMMSSSQVKFDKVPMPPPQGSTPIVVGTLQPSGVRFDPPAQVIYPNVEGLAPGDVADIFAFHHDIGQFVNIGPGTVSEDGSVVVSDPGFGIVQSGWHCLIRIPGPSSHCANGCIAVATTEGRRITDSNPIILGVGEGRRIGVGFSTPGDIQGNWSIVTGVEFIELTQDPVDRAVVTIVGKKTGTARIKSPTNVLDATRPDFSCAVTIDVLVTSVKIVEVISEQFPGQECNKLPPLAHAAANTPMLLATVDGRMASVSLRTRVDAGIGDKARVGVRQSGSLVVLAEAPAMPFPAKATLNFEALTRNHELVAGVDSDGDGKLDEVTHVFEEKVRVITETEYLFQKGLIEGLLDLLLLDIAQDFVDFFLAKRDDLPEANKISSLIRSTTPTHPLGALWTSSCEATIDHFTFDNKSKVSKTIAQQEPIENLVKRALDTDEHKQEVQMFFAEAGSPPTAIFPRPGNPSWNWGGSVSADDFELERLDITLSFGSFTISEGTISEVEVEKDTLNVIRIVYAGQFDDLYDFNFNTISCRPGAIVQAGFGTLGSPGRIFSMTVRLQRETSRTDGFNYSFR